MIRVRVLVLVMFGLLGTSAMGAEPSSSLEEALMPLIRAHKGKVAVAVKDLATGETFAYHQDDPMPTASLIKFPVMVEVYRRAEAKEIDLGKMVTLKKGDKVPGTGILTYHFSEGATFPLLDAVHLMIAFSDNTATNMVLDEIGIGSTAETMEKMGYPNTKVHSKSFKRETSVFPERSKRFGLGSTTAAEMLRLCEALQRRELVSKEASEAMLKHMRACDDKDKFSRFLPPGTKVAFKTGTVDASRTTAGIIEGPGDPIALCVLTDENEDRRYHPENAGTRLCAEIARAAYDHFAPKKDDPKPRDAGKGQ